MIITWYGQACFKIQSGDKTAIIDPYAKSIGLNPPSAAADVVFVTHEHSDHSNTAAIRGEYLLVNGPGEYEIKGINARGIDSFHDNQHGAQRGLNTVYRIEVEGVRVLHLGDIGQEHLEDKQVEAIGEVDVLMIPVGGFFTIDAKQAVGITNQLEPKIVIPMHYKLPKIKIAHLSGVNEFLKEFGEEDAKAQDKLVVKQKDFGGDWEKTQVVLLKP